MLIDWFTVAAQALNFLMLVWLLKRFLYRPVLDAIDARERGIAAELADAAAKKADARKERDEFEHKNREFDAQRAALVKGAADAAAAERERLLDGARKDADAARATRQDDLRSEQRDLSREIVRWTRTEVFAIARKALAGLADASLDERMCDVFVQRLRGLTGVAKDQLGAALKTAHRPAAVRTAFDLPPAQQRGIQTAVNETFAADVPLQFETVPELVSGIELSANGQKVAWSIGEYLGTLERSAGDLLKKEEPADEQPALEPAPKAEPKAGVKSQPAKPEPKANPKPNPKP
jgi:F-type H+-transporting ATPase subunit b